jgi:hypothetical protein
MLYYLDTEFAEDGTVVELISIGIVSEDGREFYRECADYKMSTCNTWVKRHVLPKLSGKEPVTKEQIRQDLLDFIGDDENPRFVAYVAVFDHLCLTQIFGGMHDMPKEYPHYTWDLRQWLDDMHIRGVSRMRKRGTGTHHHALHDAHWLKGVCEQLMLTQGLRIPPNMKKGRRTC